MGTRIISFISMRGGTGKTTTVANLSTALAETGHVVAAIDMDPQNALGLHFGMSPDESLGISDETVTAHDLAPLHARVRAPLHVVPFGASSPLEVHDLEAQLRKAPEWLRMRIDDVTPEDADLVLIDAPAGITIFTLHALAVADLIVVVMEPDGGCYATLPLIETLLAGGGGPAATEAPSFYLVNKMNARLRLSRNCLDAFREALGPRVLPNPLIWDEGVRESLARQHTLVGTHATSPYSTEVRAIARWILDHFGLSVLAVDVA